MSETLIENIVIYGVVVLVFGLTMWFYLRKLRNQNRMITEKIVQAKSEGLYEPVSLHPVVDPKSCIQSGACIVACPEKDILGIVNGRATTINASRCIGHGACFHACPTQAITLYIGTEKRGVDLPHVDENFETNVPGLFIAGEIGGMGLIRNAVEQGRQAVENLAKGLDRKVAADYDLVIIGAGPAGISASLAAKKLGLSTLTLEQDFLGGTVFSFPRSKIVMTSPMDLPLHGKVRLFETSKQELLDLWQQVIEKHEIRIRENVKVESISRLNGHFEISVLSDEIYTSRRVLLAIGRRGTPRKLNVPGEESPKVAYRLLDPERIREQQILVVGGGDSAIEAALLLADQNEVVLSYRGAAFNRLKPANKQRIDQAKQEGKVTILYQSNVVRIEPQSVSILLDGEEKQREIENDLVYIFAGGELPTQFLEKAGIKITRKFGESVLKHKK
ncbi:NAD(P)-binding domain-containing protein [Mangrovibacterium diazotrophicum]|uniref:Thioredoxin reductase n=1 Tax=Mangrovibacterium diazotrophicum TaxID=1261403 RepID=A0A419W2P7_9BACT|nr:NAD(P)-binding domain-containing protein [Mangrovibacterium diazotrophicum]RKD89757.1 thioredoxin reductase [Mangrovibacterium diazotrophicum]